jgi:hypothetical protein
LIPAVKVTLWRCTDVWLILWRFWIDADRRLIDAYYPPHRSGQTWNSDKQRFLVQ